MPHHAWQVFIQALTTHVTATAGVDLSTTMVGGGMRAPGGIRITVPITTTTVAIGTANAHGDGDTAPGDITAACVITVAIERRQNRAHPTLSLLTGSLRVNTIGR
jgi:hypothetical protein